MSKAVPLDEVVHFRPDVAAYIGGMDKANGIHRYLTVSPFFDHSTKEGLLFAQSETQWQTYNIVQDRTLLENNLRQRPGVEYMIAGEPVTGDAAGTWVVRKQDRVKGRGRDDEIKVLGTYYTVGMNLYQAPSVGDVVGNRMLSALSSLSNFFTDASSLPTYEPSTGYAYLPTTTPEPRKDSAHGSPSRSREGSVVPGADAASQRSGSVAPAQPDLHASRTSEAADTRLLAQSLQMMLSYSDEYLDENPLRGEPGNFSFTTSQGAVRKRKAGEEAAAGKAQDALKSSASSSKAAAPAAEKAPSPPVVAKVEEKPAPARKASRIADKRRRKSKPNNSNPTEPGSAVSTTGPGI